MGCFLKANWHAPVDAKWINTGQSLCVRQLDEFYQVLKASDILREDLNRMGDNTDYVIAFREYVSNIHPGSEFRCYVKRNELIGISSRWWPEFFPHFLSERSQILMEIQRFYLDHIQNKFPLENCEWWWWGSEWAVEFCLLINFLVNLVSRHLRRDPEPRPRRQHQQQSSVTHHAGRLCAPAQGELQEARL